MTVDLGSETLAIVRGSTTTDPFGDVTGTVTEIPVEGCSVQPRGSSENTDLRNTVISGYTVWAPAGSDVRSTDRLRWRGQMYAVEGDAGLWTDDAGAEHHIQFAIQRVTG